MPGNKLHVVTQRQQLALDSVNQLRVVTAREVTAPYAAFKQHVAGNQQPRIIIKEDHMARRMPRTVQHLQLHVAHADGIAFI